MIQANELRVGNCLIFKGTTVKIDKYNLSGILINNALQYYSPIPLTEDILLKCGFDNTEGIYILGDLIIDCALDWMQINNSQMSDIVWLDCPEYLHHIQNIYFALTRKELEIIYNENRSNK